jgi:two-component system sensor histidine kinase TctE
LSWLVLRAPGEQRSLFGEILDWMLAPLLLLWPMSVLLTWLVAQGIANQPYDRQLIDMVRVLAQQVSIEHNQGGGYSASFTLPHAAAEVLRTDELDDIYFQVLGLRGEYLSGDGELPVPPPGPAATGSVMLRDDVVHNAAVRVAYVWIAPSRSEAPEPAALVQVAETLGKRSQLATEIVKGVILPQFAILPLAVLLVSLALARGIAPLSELQQRIRRRESTDLSPIDEGDAPEEVGPLVRAINDLLTRLDQSILSQKHFLADAAHQLKTPLAGLRTQAELAQREIDAGTSSAQALKKSLQHIALSSERAAHMVNQLLALARAEDKEQVLRHEPLNLAGLATEAIHDFVPRAMDKRIDLGYEGPEPARAQLRIVGQPILLGELIRNLVDNALRYTPAGGTVTVRVVEDPFGQVVVLQVEDNGPGIAPGERDKVFQPFYRTLGTNVDGSGLGLAIVKEIAHQHEADVSLDETAARAPPASDEARAPGARFTVRFRATNLPSGGAPVPGVDVTAA